MHTDFKAGDLVTCMVTGDAHGNRVVKGFQYEVVEVVLGENGFKYDFKNGEGAGLILRDIEEPRRLYPFVWKFSRFQKVLDKPDKFVRVCADEYTW